MPVQVQQRQVDRMNQFYKKPQGVQDTKEHAHFTQNPDPKIHNSINRIGDSIAGEMAEREAVVVKERKAREAAILEEQNKIAEEERKLFIANGVNTFNDGRMRIHTDNADYGDPESLHNAVEALWGEVEEGVKASVYGNDETVLMEIRRRTLTGASESHRKIDEEHFKHRKKKYEDGFSETENKTKEVMLLKFKGGDFSQLGEDIESLYDLYDGNPYLSPEEKIEKKEELTRFGFEEFTKAKVGDIEASDLDWGGKQIEFQYLLDTLDQGYKTLNPEDFDKEEEYHLAKRILDEQRILIGKKLEDAKKKEKIAAAARKKKEKIWEWYEINNNGPGYFEYNTGEPVGVNNLGKYARDHYNVVSGKSIVDERTALKRWKEIGYGDGRLRLIGKGTTMWKNLQSIGENSTEEAAYTLLSQVYASFIDEGTDDFYDTTLWLDIQEATGGKYNKQLFEAMAKRNNVPGELGDEADKQIKTYQMAQAVPDSAIKGVNLGQARVELDQENTRHNLDLLHTLGVTPGYFSEDLNKLYDKVIVGTFLQNADEKTLGEYNNATAAKKGKILADFLEDKEMKELALGGMDHLTKMYTGGNIIKSRNGEPFLVEEKYNDLDFDKIVEAVGYQGAWYGDEKVNPKKLMKDPNVNIWTVDGESVKISWYGTPLTDKNGKEIVFNLGNSKGAIEKATYVKRINTGRDIPFAIAHAKNAGPLGEDMDRYFDQFDTGNFQYALNQSGYGVKKVEGKIPAPDYHYVKKDPFIKDEIPTEERPASEAGTVTPGAGEVAVNFMDEMITGEYSSNVEIVGNLGDVVKAAQAGRVIFSGDFEGGLGKTVIIEYADGKLGTYANLIDFEVNEGDKIEKGGNLGILGLNKDGLAHLWYQVSEDGIATNPF